VLLLLYEIIFMCNSSAENTTTKRNVRLHVEMGLQGGDMRSSHLSSIKFMFVLTLVQLYD